MPFQSCQPLISVITPVYNAESYLPRAIDSVLNQSYKNLELILVDDGSTDNCGALCDAAAVKDGRVKVIHQANGGVSAARNAGLAAAQGAYVAWLDSDDYLEPEMLETLLNALQEHGKHVALCNYTNIMMNGTRAARYPSTDEVRVYDRETMMGLILGIGITPVLWANLMERRLYDGIQFPEGHLFEDVRVTYRLHERPGGAVMVMRPLLVRTQRANSISRIRNMSNRVDGGLSYIERYEDAVARWPQYGPAMLVASARTLHLLRQNVLTNSPRKFRGHRKDIGAICAFYRSHKEEILPKDAGFFMRMEFYFLTSGSYLGFAFSKLTDYLALHPRPFILDIKTPGLPPF